MSRPRGFEGTLDLLTPVISSGTTQACLFRDEFTPLTATGYAIYGLSTDSVKSNTNFKNKQNLPYGLLCDPSMTLIGAIGMRKSPSGTTRGVFVINKDGKVEAVSPGVSLSLHSCHCELDWIIQFLTRVLLLPLILFVRSLDRRKLVAELRSQLKVSKSR